MFQDSNRNDTWENENFKVISTSIYITNNLRSNKQDIILT